MSVPKWRKFNFFDKSPPAGLPLRSEDATCSTSGRGSVLLGDSSGVVHAIGREFTHRCSFQAHKIRVTYVHQLKRSNQVLTIGDEDAGGQASSTCIKLWNWAPLSPATGPPLVREVKAFAASGRGGAGGGDEAVVTCAAVWEELGVNTVVAMGLVGGDVQIVRGDLARDRVTRYRLQAAAPDVPVTGLGFRAGAMGEALSLFVVTLAQTLVYHCQPGAAAQVLDEAGAGPRCAAVTEEGELVVGRPEAAYFYDVDGRGPCLAFSGEKDIVAWTRGHLVVVSTGAAGAAGGGEGQQHLHVYDIKNKLVAYSARVEGVSHILVEWGSLVVVGAEGASTLQEKDMGSKLDTLFRKNLYPIALSLTQDAEPAALAEVHRKFGDHLYGKQDYDGAMEQYLRTIGQLEASYVIRKFLDAARIHHLTQYLEELHEGGHATADHTTLLLNCFTKLKGVDKLRDFVRRKEGEGVEEYRARLGVEAAVRMCRGAGYHDLALHVAEQAGEPAWRLQILLEDCGKYDEALAFLGQLAPADAEAAIKQYGKSLATARPVETTALLMGLCTLEEGEEGTRTPADPAVFEPIFVDRPSSLVVFFEYLLEQPDRNPEPLLYNTLLKLYLARVLPDELGDVAAPGAAGGGGGGGGAGWEVSAGEPLTEDQERAREARLGKALELLKRGWPLGAPQPRYDGDTALVLCRTHGFTEGTLYLYERLRLHAEVLAMHMASGDHGALIESCTRLADESRGGDPSLWVDVLTYFGGGGGQGGGGGCAAEVRKVLAHVERQHLLPPLVVLQTLARNPHLELSVVKDYVARRLLEETRAIEDDRRAIAQYEEETKVMREEVAELRGRCQIFKNTKCSTCHNTLELPLVHFLCSHSFHLRCLGEDEAECPLCAPENRTLLDYRAAQLRGAAAGDDAFYQQLQGSADGFGVCAEYFGRGMFAEMG